MKSERAKQFIKTQSPGDIAQYEVSLWKAKKAVEIAEEEMKEAERKTLFVGQNASLQKLV